MCETTQILVHWKFFPVDVDFPRSVNGQSSQSKLDEMERQRNCELLELDHEQNQSNEEQELKTIPLENTDEFDEDSDEGEIVENNSNQENDYNRNDNEIPYLFSNSKLCTTPQLPYGYLSASSSQPSRSLKSILKKPRKSSYIGIDNDMNNSPGLHTNIHFTSEDMSDECEEIIVTEDNNVKRPRKACLNKPPSPTGSEADLSIAYQNNLNG